MEKQKILIVEDETIIALDIKTSLESFGYEVVGIASSAQEAIEKAGAYKPNVVLMDIFLKGDLDGIYAATTIYEELKIPIIFLSANSERSILERAKAAQPYGYLVKPFKDKDLQTTVIMALNKHANEQKQLQRVQEAESLNNMLEHKLHDQQTKSDFVNIGHGFIYDTKERILYKDEQIFELTAKESLLMCLLASNIGKPVSQQKIEAFVWNNYMPSPNALRTLMWRLRAKLGGDIIKNSIGIGYKIERP